jgi:hypothetical protein
MLDVSLVPNKVPSLLNHGNRPSGIPGLPALTPSG